MPLKEKDYTNDEGLKDGSLLDDKYETPVFCNKKHTHDKRCLQ